MLAVPTAASSCVPNQALVHTVQWAHSHERLNHMRHSGSSCILTVTCWAEDGAAEEGLLRTKSHVISPQGECIHRRKITLCQQLHLVSHNHAVKASHKVHRTHSLLHVMSRWRVI